MLRGTLLPPCCPDYWLWEVDLLDLEPAKRKLEHKLGFKNKQTKNEANNNYDTHMVSSAVYRGQ